MRAFRRSSVGLVFSVLCLAQSAAYDPRLTFAPLTLPDSVNAYRSGNGAPGPSYWQNEAGYELHAELDTAAKGLKTNETISYTNNSPDVLHSLWVQLDQNIYKQESRAKQMGVVRGRRGREAEPPENTSTDGFVLDAVEIEGAKHFAKAEYIVSDTRMQIRLATPLAGHGARLKIHIRYHYRIPGVWGGRTSWGKSEKGEIYDIAQWYPRMAVYDDLRGWDTLPYIGVGVLSRIRQVRLLHHGAFGDADRGLRRADESKRSADQDANRSPREGAHQR